jgi:hypothetical protein
MGEQTVDPGVVAQSPGGVLTDEIAPDPPASKSSAGDVLALGRRRFTIASLVGVAVAAVPFLWILWGVWESPSFLRKLGYQTNFYDIQARAMLRGTLVIPKGSIGVEEFVHNGRNYTYFGLFPSILRLPILIFTHSLDGRLTAPSILLAWLVSATFFVLLAWRVRLLVRGDAPVGQAEAVSFGILTTTFLSGSVFLWLASTPYVFSEDLAWSVALTVGSIFCLLGVIERPSWGSVIASGILMIAANQDRSTTGWATTLAALLIGGWFWLGRGGPDQKRWALPIAGAGVIAAALGAVVNYAKFGMLFGLPINEQVYSMVNVYRQKFLAANHNSEVGMEFIPSNLLAYLRPDGIQFSSVFPFITLPASPAPAIGGVLFDRLYRTASLPASMPLLTGLSFWGLVSAFRPRPPERVARTRLLLLAAGSAGAALMFWGYIAPRYLADFLPFLAIGATVGLADVWRRQDGKTHRRRVLATAVIALVALYSLAANIGIAITPTEQWTTAQTLGYVQTQKSISDLMGNPIANRVVVSDSLPNYAPAGQIRIIGACDALYISNGENYTVDPSSQFNRDTWQVVEYGHALQRLFYVTPRAGSTSASVPLVVAGAWTITIATVPRPGGRTVFLQIIMERSGPRTSTTYRSFKAIEPVNGTHQVTVLTDPYKRMAQVSIDGNLFLNEPMANGSPVSTPVTPADASPTNAISVIDATAGNPPPALCMSLLPEAR